MRAVPLALLVPLALAGCESAAPSAPAPDPAPPAPEAPAPSPERPSPGPPAAADDPRAAEAVDAIRAGDHERARALLGDLVRDERLEEARALLAEDRPEDALLRLDDAAELGPEAGGGRLLRARAELRLAERGIAEGAPGMFVEGMLLDALAHFREVEASGEALLGASRAALLLGRPAEALELARAADRALGDAPPPAGPSPERVLAEAAYNAYVAARRALEAGEGATAPDDVRALVLETEEALDRLLGRAADDPWVPHTLAYLYEWEGRLDDARAALERGLDRLPDDESLVRHLAEVARRAGGLEGSVAALERYRARHPDVAIGAWYEGYERFYLALERLEAGAPDADAFRAAEAAFAACRALDPALDEACRGYETICRDGEGWCLYQEGDLAGAEAAFRSMDELVERGLEWRLEGRLLSGVDGLVFVADAHRQAEDWLAAAEIYDFLRGYVPDAVDYANNAGFFFRDAAVELEYLGRRLCRAASGAAQPPEVRAELRAAAGVGPELAPGSEAEREALRRAADERMERARALMRRSRDAYLAAAALAPDDVRVQNDTALVLVYYLHEDLERAEELLRRAVRLGEQQLAAGDLDEDARWELENAWGDAFQNLGVLYANRGDHARAIEHFERAVEIGPDPRPVVVEHWLPYLRGGAEGEVHPEILATSAWAEPCAR